MLFYLLDTMSEHNYSGGIRTKYSINEIFDLKLSNEHHFSFLLDEFTLISNQFEIFTSFILCFIGLIAVLFYLGIFIHQYCSRKSFSNKIFIQSLFDLCHLVNILFPHLILIIVYQKTLTKRDQHCPLSTFCFSLVSIISIGFLCLGAFNRYMYFIRKQTQYRYFHYRLFAHRLILITSISWLIFHFPKIDFRQTIVTSK